MKVTAEKLDAHKTVLELEIPQPEVAKAINKAYQRLAGKVNIPGFRKGKVPRKVLEMRLGKDALLDEAFDIIAPQAYIEALKEQNIEPVARPDLEVVTFTEDQPLVFKATVIAKPEITVGEYKGLKVEKPSAEVDEAEVDKQIDVLRNRHAKMVVAENAVIAKGDFAIIDFEGFMDGEAFEGGGGKGYPLEIGAGAFIPGFEDQLIGAKAGDELDVNVTFPEDYHAKPLAGKAAVFKVKVTDVKRKEIPDLDDEFVKDIGEFNTVEELKADVRNNLLKAAEDKVERTLRANAVQAAVDNATVDIPEVMVESQIDHMIQDMDIRLQNSGMNLNRYLEFTNTTMETMRENYQEAAKNSVKTELLLDAIVKAEGLEASVEDLDAEIAIMAAAYQAPAEEVKRIIIQEGRIESLTKSILRKKAAEVVINSVVTE
ncbi:MAG: Trigger factor [Firmicutes bacterium]|nr:Trigger factor [Bacillota bacterium]